MRPRYQLRRGSGAAGGSSLSRLVWLMAGIGAMLLLLSLHSTSLELEQLRPPAANKVEEDGQQAGDDVAFRRPTMPLAPIKFFEHFEEDLIIHDVGEDEDALPPRLEEKGEEEEHMITEEHVVLVTPEPIKEKIIPSSTPTASTNTSLIVAIESPAKEQEDGEDDEDSTDDQLDLLEDDEEQVVDEDAKDVFKQSAHHSGGEDSENEDDDYQQLETFASVPLPQYSMKHLESLGFGKFLLVYRVLATTGVYTRSKPQFLSKFTTAHAAAVISDSTTILRDLKQHGEIVVGYKLVKESGGLWLKLAPRKWIPITSHTKSSASSSSSFSHKLMKQIMTISLPSNLKRYWGMSPKRECKSGDTVCKDKDSIRRGVLQVMRELGLMTPAMDPESSVTSSDENEVVEEEEDDQPLAANLTKQTLIKCIERATQQVCAQSGVLPLCEWDAINNKCEEVLPEAASHQTKFDFTTNTTKATKGFLLYQPMASSDWNVQRIQFENSLILCKLLNRTCIAPPVHSAQQAGLLAMSRLVNFDVLTRFVSVQTVPQHVSLQEFRDKLPVLVKQISLPINKFGEQEAIKEFGGLLAPMLYFSNLTIGSFDWKGSAQGFHERRLVHSHLMYADHVKHVARKLSEAIGPYHAVHIHQIQTEQTRELAWWLESMAQYRDMTEVVYVVNPHGQRSELEPIAARFGFRPLYLADMTEEMGAIVRPYLDHYPESMRGMVSGMIEQLVCGYALMFLGSGSSPFTAYVLRLRKFRDTLATDTRFEDKPLGLPAIVRNLKTNCEPIRVVYHTVPC
ncbi:hypothetical protein BASA81_003452 [Batrachochytrium salamandrivorans]|nr:hypothetical protein BASA81_003452 [Batrachochytrium salamandrivorans]